MDDSEGDAVNHDLLYENGLNEKTPSIPLYFSWINNTWEGSTEEQTLVNLDFFAWLKRTYGMQLGVYLWDTGNYDGPGEQYGSYCSRRFQHQYPNGFGKVAEKAAELGIRMGLWCGPDGFGDSEEEENERIGFLVDLFRKHHFALIKLDAACGYLRPEKARALSKAIQECRKICPDLVVLSHRLDLYEAKTDVTTFLWQGTETYVDVHSANNETCMHHRGFIFDRGYPEGLERLAEDCGVCISSSVAFFEDDLIYQSFGRSMILAPEIYGNPWLMRDDEFPKLARIFNLHRHAAPLLVNGMPLPDTYGNSPVSRGTGTHRFITTGHHGWTERKVIIRLDSEIGLEPVRGKIALIRRHPTEKLIGVYDYGDTIETSLMPFRACLFEVAPLAEALPVLTSCEYEVLKENSDGAPEQIKMVWCDGGEIDLLENGSCHRFGHYETTDIRDFPPVFLGRIDINKEPDPRAEEFYEAAQFAVDNDSLERREARRAGKTGIPEVQAARDAFFDQETYRYRGCDNSALFDGDPESFYDGYSKTYRGGQRISGGCLRVDFGEVYSADEIEIVCFSASESTDEIQTQAFTEHGTVSDDLKHWRATDTVSITVEDENASILILKDGGFTNYTVPGRRVKATYRLDGMNIRYFRLPYPMDRIFSVRLLKDGRQIALRNPRANNLQAPFEAMQPVEILERTVQLPEVKDGDYIAVALNGVHGLEGAYCVAEMDGNVVGFPDRAPAYRANMWEYRITRRDRNYTYYLPLTSACSRREMCLRVLLCDMEHTDVSCEAWLCPKH